MTGYELREQIDRQASVWWALHAPIGELSHHCNGTGMRCLPSSTVTNTAAKCIACGGTGWWRKA